MQGAIKPHKFNTGNASGRSPKASLKTNHLALWCNGSTSDSGSACEGSNPSKATKRKSQLINFTQLRFFYCSKRME